MAADGWLTAAALAHHRRQLLDGKASTLQQWYVYVLEHWYRESSKMATDSAMDWRPDWAGRRAAHQAQAGI
jgi:hypothetical protein